MVPKCKPLRRRKEWFQNVNLSGGEKSGSKMGNLSSINSGANSCFKNFFPDKPHSLETKFLDAFLEENLSAKSQ